MLELLEVAFTRTALMIPGMTGGHRVKVLSDNFIRAWLDMIEAALTSRVPGYRGGAA